MLEVNIKAKLSFDSKPDGCWRSTFASCSIMFSYLLQGLGIHIKSKFLHIIVSVYPLLNTICNTIRIFSELNSVLDNGCLHDVLNSIKTNFAS